MAKVRYCMIVTLVLAGAVSLPGSAAQQKASTAELLDLSLAELLEVEVAVPASITEKDPLKTPASVTVITSEDIDRTPARDILDLLEIYVPGAIYMNHSVGPLPGLRGIIVDRPYKFLVNVNGVNVNIKAHYGARLELLNWDLSDIARIEVIRGPGSVTYGPGAIAGVINIYTKTARQAPGLELGTRYWSRYDSMAGMSAMGRLTRTMSFMLTSVASLRKERGWTYSGWTRRPTAI